MVQVAQYTPAGASSGGRITKQVRQLGRLGNALFLALKRCLTLDTVCCNISFLIHTILYICS